MRDLIAASEADDNLRGLGHFLCGHLLEVAKGILRAAEAAHCTAIFHREVIRLEQFLLIVSGIANEMKSREYGPPEADSFALGPVLV
jgi:hypothetical protein